MMPQGYIPNQPQSFITSQQPEPAKEEHHQAIQRQKQDEYRRFLEQQVKEKEEQKKQKELLERQLDAKEAATPITGIPIQANQQPPSFQPPQPTYQQPPPITHQQPPPRQIQDPHSAPSAAPSQQGPRPKITSAAASDPQAEEERKSRQLQYQEELQRQVEEKKRLREEEKRRRQQEDEALERKMHLQQQELHGRDRHELAKEGRGLKEERRRNVRRDLFEPSSDNHMAVAKNGNNTSTSAVAQSAENSMKEGQQASLPQQNRGFQGFNVCQKVDLPINQREVPHGLAPLQQFNNEDTQMFKRESFNGGIPPFQQQSLQYQNNRQSFSDPPQQAHVQRFQDPQLAFRQAQFESDYSQFLGLYQRAFQEIIDFKNQYVEEVTRMRERMAQEREEIADYERMKHQQQLELHNLRSVYDRLGQMITEGASAPTHTQPATMNPVMQENLNQILIKQQQDIMRLSQSGLNFKAAANHPSHQAVVGGRPQMTQQEYLAMMKRQHQLQESPNILEQSLSSDTKFVVVPQNKLAGVAQINQAAANQPPLMQTWKEEDTQQIHQQQQKIQQAIELMPALQTLTQSLTGSSQFITGMNQTPLRHQLSTFKQGRPHSGVPEVIQELPSHQEDDSKLEERRGEISLRRRRGINEEEQDFNSRESSKTRQIVAGDRSQEGQQLILVKEGQAGDTSKSFGNTIGDNMNRIDSIINGEPPRYTHAVPLSLMSNQNHQNAYADPLKTSSKPFPYNQNESVTSPMSGAQKTQMKTQEKFNIAANTGSSFYNATMQLQKQQEQSQQEELQKQLLRIYGGGPGTSPTPQPDTLGLTAINNRDQEGQGLREVPPPGQYFAQTYKSAVGQDPLGESSASKGRLHPDDLLNQSQINIADSYNEETQKNGGQFSLLKELSQQAAVIGGFSKYNSQSNVRVVGGAKDIEEEIEESVPVEVKMNERPKRQEIRLEQTESQLDVWNDPDLVPPPVVHIEDDDMIEQQEEDQDFELNDEARANEYSAYDPPAAYVAYNGNQPFGNSSSLNQLRMLSPPSEEEVTVQAREDARINIGSYQPQYDQIEVSQTQSSPNKGASKPPMSAASSRKQGQSSYRAGPGEDAHEISMSNKEREIIEIAKLIQKATTTTHILLENTDHFKFRFKKEGGAAQPLNTLEAKASARRIEEEEDKDDMILSNFDKMIMTLEQQQRQQEGFNLAMTEDDKLRSHRLIEEDDENNPEGVKLQSELRREESGQKPGGILKIRQHQITRPLSSVGEQPALSQPDQSQKSIGHFTQLALQNGALPVAENPTHSRFGLSPHPLSAVNSNNQQSASRTILRPVSGKSNSNRYSHVNNAAAGGTSAGERDRSRSKSTDRRQQIQQMYYESEEEEQPDQ